jgi:hypothetical protein
MAVISGQRSLPKEKSSASSFDLGSVGEFGERWLVENLDNSELHSSLMRLAIVQTACGCRYSLDMSTLMHRLYRCPNTGVRVQSYACIKTADGAYEIVTCNICRGVHLFNRASGRMLSEDEDAKVSEMAKAGPRLTVVVRNS